MNRPPLTTIPQHLLINCIQKMEPRAFARAYRSCSAIMDHIESNERRISISLPHKLYIETISDGNVIVVKATKGQGLVFWSKTFSPEEFIEVGIPSLACFNLTAISIQFNSPSHVEGYIGQLLTTFQRYRITARRGSVSHSNPYIGEIVKALRLKELEVRGPIYNPFAESWLFSDEVHSLKQLTVDRTDGPQAEHLLRHVAPRCQSVDLKFMGKVELYLGLMASCLKDIQHQGEMRIGKVSIAQIGEDVPTAAVLERFNGIEYKVIEEPDHSLLVFPFKDNGRLLLAWRKYYTPLKKLRGINFTYGTVRDEEDARRFYQMVYSKMQREAVERGVKSIRSSYL